MRCDVCNGEAKYNVYDPSGIYAPSNVCRECLEKHVPEDLCVCPIDGDFEGVEEI